MGGKAIPLGLVIDFKRKKETFGSMEVNYKVLGIMAYNTERKELENIGTENLYSKCLSIVQGSFKYYYIDECWSLTNTFTNFKFNFNNCPLFSTSGELITTGAKSSIFSFRLANSLNLYVDIESLDFSIGTGNQSAIPSPLFELHSFSVIKGIILGLTDSEVQGVYTMGDTLIIMSEFKHESLVVPAGIKNIVFFYVYGDLKEVVFNKEFEAIQTVSSSSFYRSVEKIYLSRDTTEEQLAIIIHSFECVTDIDKIPSIVSPHFTNSSEYLQFIRENSEFAKEVIGSLSVCVY